MLFRLSQNYSCSRKTSKRSRRRARASMKIPRQNKLIALLGGLSIAFASSSFAERAISSVQDYLGPQYRSLNQAAPSVSAKTTLAPTAAEVLAHWNQIAVDASGLDHTPVPSGDPRIFGEQVGPARASRAIAMVHIAMFDSVNGVLGGYKSYTNITPAKNASIPAALAQAACETLTALFPSQQATFAQALADDLSQISAGAAKTDGIDLGASRGCGYSSFEDGGRLGARRAASGTAILPEQ